MFSSSTTNCEFHDAEESNETCNDVVFEKINKVMSTLKGSKLKMFHYLMDVVSSQSTNIKNLETLVAEEKENYVLLEK